MKGIGHSSFTAEDVAKLQSENSGNEAVNEIYLARYDPNSIRERLRPPTDNNDLQLLRVWIRRKYIEKAWLQDEYLMKEEEEKNRGKTVNESSSTLKSEKKKKNKLKSKTNGNSMKPTIAALPPKKNEPTPAVDLFGGWDTTKTTKSTPNDPFNPRFNNQPNAQTENTFNAVFEAQPSNNNHDPFTANFPPQQATQKPDNNAMTNMNTEQSALSNDAFVADFDSQPKVDDGDRFSTFSADFSNINENNQTNILTQNNPSTFQNPSSQFVQQQQNQSFNADFGTFDQSVQSKNNINNFSVSQPEQQLFDNNSSASHASTFNQTAQTNNFASFPENANEPKQVFNEEKSGKTNDPFDAFANLSVSKNMTTTDEMSSLEKPQASSIYIEGQKCFYKEKDKSTSEVKIIKIHHDDELVPYYTIQFTSSGKEKQTDEAHLTLQKEEKETFSKHASIPSTTDENVVADEKKEDAKDNDNKMMTQSFSQNLVMQPITQNHMLKMIENFTFQDLLMMQQVINMKMQQIQMQQQAQFMAMAATRSNNASGINQDLAFNTNLNSSIPSTTQSTKSPDISNSAQSSGPNISTNQHSIPSPPPEAPPPPPPPPVESTPTLEKKGNPFDLF